jgi:hypothetical protein
MKVSILLAVLILFAILYIFAKDHVVATLAKARDGLAIIGAGTMLYGLYYLFFKQ